MTTNSNDRAVLSDYLEIHDRGEDRMDAQSGVVLYMNGDRLRAVDDGGNFGFPLDRTKYVQQDLTSSDAPAPSDRGHVAAHDGTGTPPSGLYESEPGSSQWQGLGLASGNTISY